jgi:B12 binding domain
MRVLLIATNQYDRCMSRMHAQPLPIGLAYLAGALAASPHVVKTLDLMFSADPLGDVEQAIRTFRPTLVGLSIRNISNGSYLDPHWALPFSKTVLDKVRALTSATIVCGGPAFSLLPQAIFAYLEPDFGLAGDAAEAFVQLADRLEADVSCHDLPGLVYRQHGAVIVNGGRCASAFTIPPRMEELDMQKYAQAGFGIGIVTKLGSFAYPTSAAQAQSDAAAWRVIRPIDAVVQDVQDMQHRYGLRKVFFIDNGFNVPLPHAKALCRALLATKVKVHWNTCLAPFGCDRELIGLMKQAGCALVLMGGMRGDPHDGLGLGARVAPMLETCRLCEEQDLHYALSIAFGEPGETRATVEEKLDFLRSIHPALATLRIGVNMLPGTAIAAQALAEGRITDEAALIKPTFYLAESVQDWIVDYLQAAKQHHPRWHLV